MSEKRLKVRLSEADHRKLELIAEAICSSRSGAIRFLVRQWTGQNKVDQKGAFVGPTPTPA